jgi:branched-chain amino acid transport system substrate-binding protein
MVAVTSALAKGAATLPLSVSALVPFRAATADHPSDGSNRPINTGCRRPAARINGGAQGGNTMSIGRREFTRSLPALATLAAGISVRPARAQKRYDPGASDTEIKIGQTMAYSGPVSSYGAQGILHAAYFRMINEQGGLNGRKINFISLDDGYSPPKTVEQTRRLVEQEQVLFIFNGLGTPTSAAVQKYLNAKAVPQIFISTGASRWNDPRHFPWTIGFAPSYRAEGKIYGQYISEKYPGAKIAMLYQNDDFGKDYVTGLKDGLGEAKANLLIKAVSYEPTDPTIDSQIVTAKESGANVFFQASTSKFAAQAIRKVSDLDWKPAHFLSSTAGSIANTFGPAGFDKSVGIISVTYIKDVNDPAYANAPDVKFYLDFMKKRVPDGAVDDGNYAYALASVSTLMQVLKQCGDDLTRENVMRQVADLHDLEVPMLLPGIRVNTSPTRFAPINQEQLVRFDGKSWVRFGDVRTAS